MKKLIFFILLLIPGLAPLASGQAPVRYLTLKEAIEIAQSQSPDALTAKQSFQTSYWEWRSYKASNLPALSFDATVPTFMQSINAQSVNGVLSYSHYKYLSGTGSVSLSQQIGITGGTFSLYSSLGGSQNAIDKKTAFVSEPISIQFTQPIFKYNQLRWDRKIKPIKYQLAKKKFVENMEAVSITAANYFFALLQAQVEKKIALINLSNYDTMYRIAKGRYQLGRIAENELLQLELNFLQAQAASENSSLYLDNAMFRFKSFLRLQDSSRIVLIPPSNIDFFRISPEKALDLAKTNASTYNDFRQRLLVAASRVNEAKLSGRFDADLTAAMGLQQQGGIIKDAYLDPNEHRQFSLSMRIPILDWGVARGNIKMAQSEEDIVKNTVEQDEIDFERNVYLKVVQFNMQQNQVMIAAKADTVARKSFEVTKGRYLIGKANDITVLNLAQVDSDNAEKNYYSALQTYWINYYEIRKLTHYDFRRDRLIPFSLEGFK